jgi:hypothetical protein
VPNVKATFTADISQFRRSLAEATTAVTAFDRTTTQVNRDLSRFGNQFSGAQIFRQAETVARAINDIGGAAKLSDSELRRHAGTINDALQKYQRLGQEAPAALRQLSSEMARLQSEGQKVAATATNISTGFGKSLSSLAAGVGVGIGFAGITALGSALSDIASEGVRLSPLQQSFERLQGGAARAEASLLALRRATHGLVSEADLLQSSNKASLLGLQQMGVDFAEVARIATVLGRAMGEDAAKSVDDLTTALSRMSPQILDNLGLKVDLTKAYADYAKQVGVTADKLTDEQKKMAFATAAMEAARAKAKELGEIELTVAEQAERIAKAFGDIGAQAISAGNQSATLAGHLQKVADVLDTIRNIGLGRSIRLMFDGILAEAQDSIRQTSQLAAGLSGAGGLAGLAGSFVATPFSALGGLRAQLGITREDINAALGIGNGASTPKPVGVGGGAPPGPSAEEIAALKKYREEIAELTGAKVVADGARLAKQLRDIAAAGKSIASDNLEEVAQRLMKARDAADQTSEAYRRMGDALNTLEIKSSRIDGLNPLFIQGQIDAASRNAIVTAQRTTGSLAGFTGLINSTNPLSMAGLAPSLQPAIVKVSQVTKNWRVELQGVVQSFAQLAQIGGRSLDGVSRTMGVVLAGASAAAESIRTLSEAIGGGLVNKDGSLNKRGGAAAGGLAGLVSGMNVGGLFTNRGLGFAAGAAGGATSGFLATAGTPAAPIATIVGGLIGGFAGMFAAAANAAARRKAKDISASQLTAEFGGLEGLLDTVGRLGLNQQTFLERFYGEPEAFAVGVTELNEALVRERIEVDQLTKSLQAAAKAQGILSRADMERLRNLRPGGPGDEVRQQFLEGQTGQLVTGLTTLLQSGQLSPDAVGSIGVSLGAAFTLMRQQGVSVKQILDTLGPALDAFRERAIEAGLGSTEQFDNLARMLETLRGPMGDVIDGALGAGQALAALTNTGMINQDMFGGLTRAITDAYKTLELNGKGGVDAVLLLQGPLQNIWQLMEDFGLQVDADTQSLIDFALQAGLIGEDFRPATEQMVEALEKLIERMDEFLRLMAQVNGIEWPAPTASELPTMPTEPGDVVPFATGGIVTRPTRALIGEAGPEAVIPLSRLRMGGGDRSWTVEVPIQVDGDTFGKAVLKYGSDARRLVRA